MTAGSPERASVAWRLILGLLRRTPRAFASRLFGRLADVPLPRPLRGAVLGAFSRIAGARIDEAERPLDEYGSLNAFFVRRLSPGSRSWPDREDLVCSPVDAVLARAGTVDGGRLLQAKGRWYTAADLLGDAERAAPFVGGLYASLYLAPRHYHRIHAPVDGGVAAASYVPGTLFPVNAPALAEIPNLLATNERVACFLDGERGRTAVVAIGAYNVGRISTAFDPEWPGGEGWVTNRRPPAVGERAYEPPRRVRRGDEIMAFHMGSSVVLLLEAGTHAWVEGLGVGEEVRLGTPMARPLA